jgi:hypothetical protein
MIAAMRLRELLRGWRRYPLPDGLLLLPPVDGVGKVKAQERAPVRRMKDVVDETVARMPAEYQSSVRVGPLVRFPTYEGEHAGLLTLSARLGPGPWERTIGMVVGDERYVLVSGTVFAPERGPQIREIVELMTRGWYMALGESRRRRFVFDPPAGWPALAGHHATRYYHPEYPRIVSSITVHDARPAQGSESEAIDRMLFVDTWTGERDPPTPPAPLMSRSNLSGTLTRTTGVQDGFRAAALRAAYSDNRFSYVLQLDTRMDALTDSVPVFEAVVRSVQPVPMATRRSEEPLSPWAD